MTARKIITDYKQVGHYTRDFDWRARREGDDDTDPQGFGPTEQEAIDDLLSHEADTAEWGALLKDKP